MLPSHAPTLGRRLHPSRVQNEPTFLLLLAVHHRLLFTYTSRRKEKSSLRVYSFSYTAGRALGLFTKVLTSLFADHFSNLTPCTFVVSLPHDCDVASNCKWPLFTPSPAPCGSSRRARLSLAHILGQFLEPPFPIYNLSLSCPPFCFAHCFLLPFCVTTSPSLYFPCFSLDWLIQNID